MSRRVPIAPALGPALVLVLALAGCSSGVKLEGAVYAHAVPVHRSATLEDQMGGELWGDEPDAYWKSMAWFFETDASRQEIEEFYAAALPGAEREAGASGETVFRIVPKGALAGECIEVWIDDEGFSIREEFKPASALKAGVS